MTENPFLPTATEFAFSNIVKPVARMIGTAWAQRVAERQASDALHPYVKKTAIAVYKAPISMPGRNGNGKRTSTALAVIPKNQVGYLRTGGFYGRYGSRLLGSDKERKFHDVNLADTLVAAAGTIHTGVNLIAQGITESTRVGRVAFVKSFFLREQFTLTEGVLQNASVDYVRTIVVLDKQCNGALPAVTDVLTVPTIKFFGFNNLANKNRFKILHDKMTKVSIPAAGGNGTAIETCRGHSVRTWYKKFKKPVPIEFSDVTGAITEVRSNNLFILSIGLQGVAKWDAAIRLRFTD